MLLFDQTERTLQGPAPYNFDQYSYYNESARTDIGNVRDLLEKWFNKYPEDDKEELKSRFKVTFEPTFFELFIFTLFTELGFTLEVHPEIPNTLKRPDYLAKKGDEYFYIEVKHLSMLNDAERGLAGRVNTLYDAINKTDASNFLIKLEKVAFKGTSQPRGKSIIQFINEKLKSLNPHEYTEKLEQSGFDGVPAIIYDDDKVTIEFKALPKSPTHRGSQSRSIASHPIVTMIGNDSDSIKGAVEDKALRYGQLDAPFIVCLNKQSVILDKIEINEALYGLLQLSYSENPANRDFRNEYNGQGAFGNSKNPKLTRLSGAYITNCNVANLASTAEHTLKANFHGKYPMSNSLTTINSKQIKEILNIPDDYLGYLFPF
jgi:hypothetical protein